MSNFRKVLSDVASSKWIFHKQLGNVKSRNVAQHFNHLLRLQNDRFEPKLNTIFLPNPQLLIGKSCSQKRYFRSQKHAADVSTCIVRRR